LAYQTFFLNVVVPGHTRGAITLTGQASMQRLKGCCCDSKPGDSKDAPTPKDRQNCAICNLAAHYTLPPVVDFRLSELGLRAAASRLTLFAGDVKLNLVGGAESARLSWRLTK
jgi:hypothetical protein